MLKNDNLSDEIRGHAIFNMSLLAEKRGEYLAAQRYLKKAEKLTKTTQSHIKEALAPSRGLFVYDIIPSRMHILKNLGRIYLKDGEYESAREHFEAALQELGSKLERAILLNNYGLLEFQRENIEQACDYINQAVQLAENDASSYTEFRRNLDVILEYRRFKQAKATPVCETKEENMKPLSMSSCLNGRYSI